MSVDGQAVRYQLHVYRHGHDADEIFLAEADSPFLSIHAGDRFWTRMFRPDGIESAPIASKFYSDSAIVTEVQHAMTLASNGTLHHSISVTVADPSEIES